MTGNNSKDSDDLPPLSLGTHGGRSFTVFARYLEVEQREPLIKRGARVWMFHRKETGSPKGEPVVD
ncbi:hypothetical protein [Oryza sativa Japonica Group]|uniref:Uncharacterized protein n=1 Tax=Oryza sativa subsp. japonica TaxID=39947 RepID=Q5QM22_ORYSJ|nr:hypothetical protein [Oryza sativa Japonica Group]BAD73556.1 hypothetical protein [Oryza sativa Japonica Group]